MRSIARALLAVVLVFLFVGCVVAPVVPPLGSIYSDIKAPIDIDMNQTAASPKSGEATTTSIFGLVSWGDASIQEAAKNGGITTIESVDYRYFNVLSVYQTFTTIAHGK